MLTPRPMNPIAIAFVVGTLALMYALCVTMYLARVENSGESTYFFVPGNLTLAWFPLVFAVLAAWLADSPTRVKRTLAVAAGVLWLLFLPNAPYVVTDLQHYEDSPLIAGWYDGMMLGAFVATGMLIGLVSMYVMHGVIARAVGVARAWAAVISVMPLCGFGIYIGRILQWNSWDPIVAPRGMLLQLRDVATDAAMRSEALAMTVGFAAFLGVSYLALYAIAAMGSTHSRA